MTKLWQYTDETPRVSQDFGLLEAGDLVESENPPHGGVAWFEAVPENAAIDMRRLRPAWKYEHMITADATETPEGSE